MSIVKQVSSDGAAWHDDKITVVAGSNVYYNFIVTNNGDVDLSGITLTDNPALAFKGTIPIKLAKGGSFTVTAGPITTVTGEQTDTATATGTYQGTTISCSDTATYVGSNPPPSNPKLNIVKQVSSDGAAWHDDKITVVAGSNVYYNFIVTNNGDVDLSGITLTDNPALAFKGTIPIKLAKGGSFTVTAGPITTVTGEQTDTATATGTYNGQTLTVIDTATYIGTKSTQVPEFPSMALPIAAIVGLIFISQRIRKEN